MSILGSLVMKTPGKCSYFMEGVSKSATSYKPHPINSSYAVFQNHTHCFPTFVAYCTTILYLAYEDGYSSGL
jgi:hypothetical protein